MELLQDLQKHFQSLVFNINLQYGNMISMNEFLENCQKHALMMQNVVDLFESLSERYLRLEEENRKYKVSVCIRTNEKGLKDGTYISKSYEKCGRNTPASSQR